MADQLQEMLQRIYQDGVNKAKDEAQDILLQARQQADKLKSDTEKEAQQMLAAAEVKAQDIEKRMQSDLKMAANQAMSALQNKVINAVILQSIDKQITTSMTDATFLQKLILEVVSKWSPTESLTLTVSEAQKNELEAFLKTAIKSVFAGKLKVEYSPVMKNGLIVAPDAATYKLSFTDEDFAAFFRSFLRPKTSQMLFGE